MYQLVKTKKQQKNFERTWEYFCHKYCWYNDPYAENGVRYNLVNKRETIGTIEFIPYIPYSRTSTVEWKTGDFSKFHSIAKQKGKIWEVDKLCIKEQYQRKGYFNQFSEVIQHHICEHKPDYYLAYIEQRFYRMLKINFGLQIETLGKPLVEQSTRLIPISINVHQLIQGHDRVLAGIKTGLN
ncbi:hypothetical protein LC065_08170 [Halobacillus litoralis]|uniref:hypothetical protein n=1 Tax=Halobacillus litoralis TaxID=45668 RepID=UPI001CFD6675|nr:hypothetical protein [Halobacillus litoralis]WLR49123.1 hypothetical protein LC065_08170 [Halobacillus litoralis]